ncbi:MAG: nitrilase-related carbon-nitrogen hydrolase [Solirubrobacteraceae bacterium]
MAESAAAGASPAADPHGPPTRLLAAPAARGAIRGARRRRPRGAGVPGPRRQRPARRRAHRRGGGAGRTADRLPRDVRARLPVLALDAHPARRRVLYANSIALPGEEADRIGAAARAAKAWVAIGVSEREGGTLYNTLAWFDDAGALVARHRKLLQPTHVERSIWGRGDDRDVVVVDAPFGRLGGLICSEHLMDLNRYALAALGEQIHVAAWPALSAVPYDPGATGFDDYSLLCARYHAVAAQAHVISVAPRIDQAAIERLGLAGRPDVIREGGGATAIVDPNGRIVAGPHHDDEAIVCADLEPDAVADAKRFFDAAGHYARPDVFAFGVDRRPQTPLSGG